MSVRDIKTFVPQPRSYKQPPFTAEVPGAEKVEGETIPRRNVRALDQLKSIPEPDVKTVYDILRRASQQYGNAKAVGKRRLIQLHEETEKIHKIVDGKEKQVEKNWTYYQLSDYEYLSFSEYEQLALTAGCGFRALGLEPHKDRVHMFAATHPNWLAAAHGAMSQSLAIATAYDTLGEEGLKHSLMQTNAKAVFLDPHLLVKLINPLKDVEGVQHVVYNDDGGLTCKVDPETVKADIESVRLAHPHLNFYSWSELIKLGEDNKVEPVPPSPDDLACIMYTSGSTGVPKGVLISHKNIVAAVAGIDVIFDGFLGPGDGFLTYLPLAHILEVVVESSCLYWGCTMGYGHPKTLFDTSMKKCRGDVAEFKPTVLVGVPAVWELVKKGIIAKVGKLNPISRNLFWGAIKAKSFMMGNSSYLPLSGAITSLVDNTILKKVAAVTGGRLRFCMTGGGPIAQDTQRFISMCIGPMISGYGLTETVGVGAFMDPLSWTDNALGEIPGCAEVKLVDYVEAGYLSTNKPPQGEIWFRGDCVTSGYLDLDKENKESFSKDGWFKTGDIGEFDSYGQVKIIDRKKNLIKMFNGEYIALEKMESIYRSCSVVGNVCVHVVESQNKAIAIVMPSEPALKQLASDHGIHSVDLESLCHNDDANSLVLKELQAAGKKAGLKGSEIVEAVVLTEEEWTPQNGLVTSVQKLNRRGLQTKYKEAITKVCGG